MTGNSDKSFKNNLKKARSLPFQTYKAVNVGNSSMMTFLLNELVVTFIHPIPGAAGIILRKLVMPWLLQESRSGLILGRSATIRHPHKLKIGKNVTIDDYVLIDARGHGDTGVTLGDQVIINRGCALKAKTGPIHIGSMSNIGSGTSIISNSCIEIGESVMIAGGCHINSGGYRIDDTTNSIVSRGVSSKGPIKIGDDVWIGTGAIILGGVSIGSHAVVGAGAVVRQDVPEYGIVGGVPARLIRKRTG